MFERFIKVSILALSIVLPLQVAKAIESLTTAELAEHCSHYEKEPTGVDAVFCVRYIQGFIDGAIATDEKVAQNAIEASNDDETFSERAIRLRKARQKQTDPTYYAEFCLGASVPLKSVVENVIQSLEKRRFNPEELPAREAVYQILRNSYPCKKTESK